MATLPAVLTDPDVEVVDLHTTVDRTTFERRREAVEAARNRAAAAAVHDDEGRLLLARAGDAWRLPGTSVGAVTDVVGELRASTSSDHGLALTEVRPRWVYRQAAHHGDLSAPLYYVVCTARPAGTVQADAVDRLGWFGSPPADLVNPTVVRDRFGDPGDP